MSENMRKHLRLPLENTVYIELVSPEFGSNDTATIVRCKTLEVSREGLRVQLDQPLLTGSILQLAVELPAADTLYLVGEVAWCRPIPGTGTEPGWAAGMSLLNADDSDIDTWRTLIAAMES